ncbi:hypothetical protein MTR67_034402 [Solanum verrucosum]|uniref:Uncharacterized protein n=1 Tax=Solanum verrucosum TaxID=315347 RepID=A0AAF0U819_SOLVR|nr:hypothetical protein MTR67_034402 [Solanum verrucosum]
MRGLQLSIVGEDICQGDSKVARVSLSIISDCGTQLTSKFWGKLHEPLDSQLTFSASFHPQTNSSHSSIDMSQYEALYECGYKSPIGWFEAGNMKPLGVDVIRKS